MAYTITGRKSGSIRFMPDNGTIQSEQKGWSGKVTAYPIEDGSDINDHVIKDPLKFSVSGVLVGGGQETLEAMYQNRDILTYAGRERIGNLVINNLTFDYKADNMNGSAVKISFQQVTITAAQYVPTGAAPLMSQQQNGTGQTKPTGNQGLQTTRSEYVASFSGPGSTGSSGGSSPSPAYNGMITPT